DQRLIELAALRDRTRGRPREAVLFQGRERRIDDAIFRRRLSICFKHLLNSTSAGQVPYDAAMRGVPQLDGELKVNGSDHPIEILRDPSGIPHVRAKTTHDA